MSNETAYWDAAAALPGMSLDEMQIVPKSGRNTILFHTMQRKNEYQSRLQQRPVFEERVHVTIIIPGDTKTVIDRPVRESDKEKYAREWAHWERTKQNKVSGTPIDMWYAINDTQKAEFKAMNIQTIEQFANLPDGTCQKIMGGLKLRQMAQTFVEAGKDAEIIGKIKAESQAEIDVLRKQLEDLKALMEEKTAPAKAK